MASNDPTDTGGLFIGRRPGTGPVRYRDGRTRIASAGGVRTACSRTRLLAVELLLCLSLFGPQPLAWFWIGSQVDYQTGYVTAGIAHDHARLPGVADADDGAGEAGGPCLEAGPHAARGHRQERGALERIFAGDVGVALVLFAVWFFVIQGPGPTLAPSS